ncbi:lipid-A-disaccharide synthase N-terminal domain-containing protein [Salegentibacter sp.]|uniref:lipid-A-disaccharide synthase N-terminal domain-containing protein n=1 Tax=Salegentibacter sp. TaxID=1903072 RepID=UPI0035686DDA
MTEWQVYSIGFAAQILFSARLLNQWIVSEKNKKVLTPSLFWKLSLIASFLLFVYGYLRSDFSIMLGQAITYFIYIRNIQLQGKWNRLPVFFRWFLYSFPIMIITYSYFNNTYDIQKLFYNEAIPIWLMLLGILAQLIFNFRFIYQWIHSERAKESMLPLGFWVLSLLGSGLILLYAIFRKDPVLLAGHLMGSMVYIRNILLNNREYVKA